MEDVVVEVIVHGVYGLFVYVFVNVFVLFDG